MSAVKHSHDGLAAATASDPERSPQTATDNEAATPEAGNVDKIREILFGGQMRDYDKRFSRLEERLLKESTELREDSRKRFEALEMFVNKEFAALASRLQSEQQNRETSVQTVARELQEAIRSLDGKLTQFSNQTTETQHDLRQQLLEQSKNLNEEIRRKYDDVSATLAREFGELNNDKADRSALSALFTELALRLNNDFKIPGGN